MKDVYNPAPSIGDIVRMRDSGEEWKIVGPERNGKWPLSGPLPCRWMSSARTEDFELVGSKR